MGARKLGFRGLVLATLALAAAQFLGQSVHAASTGDLLVASYNGNDILRYDGTTGAYKGVFVTPGSGGLTVPNGMTYGPDGNLYVASLGSFAVIEYDGMTGSYIKTLDPTNSAGLQYPNSIVFTPTGNLLVSNFLQNNIVQLNGITGASMGVFASDMRLSGPTGMTYGPDGNLYVNSSANNSVLRFNGTTGAFMSTFIPSQRSNVSGPAGIVFSPDGSSLYDVSQYGHQSINRFNGKTGQFTGIFAQDDVLLKSPIGIAFNGSGTIFVSSFGTNGIVKINSKGFVTPFAGGPELTQPGYITFMPGSFPGGGVFSAGAPTALAPTPEPSSIVMISIAGVAGLACFVRNRRRAGH